jgi:hypothetical protein
MNNRIASSGPPISAGARLGVDDAACVSSAVTAVLTRCPSDDRRTVAEISREAVRDRSGERGGIMNTADDERYIPLKQDGRDSVVTVVRRSSDGHGARTRSVGSTDPACSIGSPLQARPYPRAPGSA